MRYIKLFENHQDKSEYYSEIGEAEYDILIDEEGNYVWDSDFKIISNLIKVYGLKIRYGSDTMNISDQSDGSVGDPGGDIDIYKLSDEWYIVQVFVPYSQIQIDTDIDVEHYGYDRHRNRVRLGRSGKMSFFKCDQVEGLIQLLKDVIPDLFF